jgi:hypothetical protein
MATGLQGTTNSRYLTVRLIDAATAATGKPVEGAAATVLKAVPTADEFFDLRAVNDNFRGAFPVPCQVLVYNTAGTNPVSVTFIRLWGYNAASGKMFPLGTGADADKGKINNAAALGETDTDDLRHAEVVLYLGMWDGIMAEVGTTGGTGAEAITVDLLIPLVAGA